METTSMQWSGVRSALCALLAFLPGIARAQPASAEINVGSLCTAVDSKEIEPNPTHDTILYQYQTMVFDLAGVVEADDAATAYSKARTWFNANASLLTCNMINFNPRNGSLLKLAVARQHDDFITDLLDNWRVDLNQVDATDQKTVLDYIRDRRANAGPIFARTLRRYYDRFRAAGARHAVELN